MFHFCFSHTITHLKEMVLRALSATARACSICVACRWWAMYCSQSRELLGEASSRRSNAAASSGRRLGSISWVSRCTRAFSAAFFSSSSSWRDFFLGWQTRKDRNNFKYRSAIILEVHTEKNNDRMLHPFNNHRIKLCSLYCFRLGPRHHWSPLPAPLQRQASGR